MEVFAQKYTVLRRCFQNLGLVYWPLESDLFSIYESGPSVELLGTLDIWSGTCILEDFTVCILNKISSISNMGLNLTQEPNADLIFF